ncbi:MAG TPA: 6-phosphofructokinase, partial [Bacteroidia bacterium]|nr:6-phosphofructokinase [Bacteroidia bacterium]
MKKIAVLTSGGDAPGMNAAIRAVVRTAIFHELEVVGIRRGFDGFMEGDFIAMDSNSVSDIIQRGGTILKTSRSDRFRTKEGRLEAQKQANNAGIEGLILIGGDGTFRGAYEFAELSGIHSIGIPGTIDNDLFGTDYTIGYDTALNTVIEAV